MSHVFLLTSTTSRAGLTTVSLGMMRVLDRLGIRSSFYKPVAQLHESDHGPERSTQLIEHMTDNTVPKPISLSKAKSYLGSGNEELLMEEVIELYRQSAKDVDVVIVEGLVADSHAGYATRLNTAIARALDAEVILVAIPEHDLEESINIAANAFSGNNGTALIGVIINKLGKPETDVQHRLEADLLQASSHENQDLEDYKSEMAGIIAHSPYQHVGSVPWKQSLNALRMCDIAEYLHAKVINKGEIKMRRVQRMEVCARSMANTLGVYQPHTLLILPGDREDIFVAACMAAMNGVRIAGILLTGGLTPKKIVLDLCAQAIQTGIPVLLVESSSFQTASELVRMPSEVAVDDFVLIDQAMDHVANHIDTKWLKERCDVDREPHLSPAAFRYQVILKASEKKRRIVLPEGDEPRTVMAAHKCHKRNVAQCILLGNPEKIHQVAASQGITLDEAIQIIDPELVRKSYIDPMVILRQAKGMTSHIAEDQLQDRVVLGTMMLAMGEVDGLVSGALHTTANTVRPAFQLIGVRDDAELVSSVFFMCLPGQVVVYADCAINPDPDANQLADIAIQSADTASHFGLKPKVAMISYSTGESGMGKKVDKVRLATKIVRQRRPDLMIDGPLQYDAAAIISVGLSKAPDSQVAGNANVFIFPDLDTGNTTYKAVQRSASVASIGPMLQGLCKPVNDLSRGALVEDIVYTIALTAVQAGE